MRHIFLNPADIKSEFVTIAGADYHHLANVLRIQIGERIVLLDNLGNGFEAEIASVDKKTASARILGQAQVLPEPVVHATVAQAVGKGDRLEQVIQHGSEIGASAFIPLFTQRTVVKIAACASEEKLDRLRKIAKGAAEQCGRARVPEIERPVHLSKLVGSFCGYDLTLFLDPAGSLLVGRPDSIGSSRATGGRARILLCIGPEGGFTPDEVGSALAAGARLTSVGTYVLRTETAALVALSQIMLWA